MVLFHVAGFLFKTAALLLFVLALCGFPMRPSPVWVTRSMGPLAFILIGSSAVVLSAYVAEFLIAAGAANKFERFTFFAGRFESWLYWLEILAALLPQLFWFPRMRRFPPAILCIALGSQSPRIFEYAVIAITEAFRST